MPMDERIGIPGTIGFNAKHCMLHENAFDGIHYCQHIPPKHMEFVHVTFLMVEY